MRLLTKKYPTIIVLILLSCQLSTAQANLYSDTPNSSLGRFAISTWCHSPRSLSANFSTDAALSALTATRSRYKPTIDAEANVGLFQQESRFSNFPGSDLNGDFTELTVSARQKLYDGGETSALIGESKARIQTSKARQKTIEQAVLFEAMSAAIELRRSRELLQLNETSQSILTKQRAITSVRVDLGENAGIDKARTDAALLRANSAVILANAQVDSNLNSALIAIGHSNPLPFLEPSLKEIADKLLQGEADPNTIQNHPRIQEIIGSSEAAEQRVKVIRNSYNPKVAATASINRVTGPVNFGDFNDDSETTTSQIRVGVTVPIYTGGLKRARVSEAKALANQSQYDLADTRRTILRDYKNSLTLYLASKNAFDKIVDAVKQAEIVINGTRKASLSGLVSTIDFLATEELLLTVRSQEVNAEANVSQAALSLIQSAGLLTLENLTLGNKNLNDQFNFKCNQ